MANAAAHSCVCPERLTNWYRFSLSFVLIGLRLKEGTVYSTSPFGDNDITTLVPGARVQQRSIIRIGQITRAAG